MDWHEENGYPFFITNGISTVYADLQASYDLFSDHSPIIATISTSVAVRQPPPRLHTSQTNWETFRNLVRGKVHLAIRLKEREDVEVAIDNFISILQQVAQEATSPWNTQRPTIYTTSAIKRLVATKQKARTAWQRIHTPYSRRFYKQVTTSNLRSVTYGMHPLLHMSPPLKEMITLSGNQSKTGKTHKHQSLQSVNARHRWVYGPRVTNKEPTFSLNTYRQYSVLTTTTRIRT